MISTDTIQHFTISIIVVNRAGALSRITGLFSKRGYNIDTLTVGPMAERPGYSRLILASSGDEATKAQIIKQLRKLVDVAEAKTI
ncbi:MAG: acetolactate synthase small subunit [Coriobacteriales bacterium]|jgi:acetolactate synthase-1/3 small subunit|nr:acetolactate synthase small subunit [Coriobacteriales bacterium]